MRCLLITIGLLSAPLGAFALTWDFDEGTTWGWTAHESFLGNYSGGCYHHGVQRSRSRRLAHCTGAERATYRPFSLLSPLIGEDSALFDRVTLRLRIIHDRPTGGTPPDVLV